eukprot:gene6458-5139_t
MRGWSLLFRSPPFDEPESHRPRALPPSGGGRRAARDRCAECGGAHMHVCVRDPPRAARGGRRGDPHSFLARRRCADARGWIDPAAGGDAGELFSGGGAAAAPAAAAGAAVVRGRRYRSRAMGPEQRTNERVHADIICGKVTEGEAHPAAVESPATHTFARGGRVISKPPPTASVGGG